MDTNFHLRSSRTFYRFSTLVKLGVSWAAKNMWIHLKFLEWFEINSGL